MRWAFDMGAGNGRKIIVSTSCAVIPARLIAMVAAKPQPYQ
jgi:hypothetical protein